MPVSLSLFPHPPLRVVPSPTTTHTKQNNRSTDERITSTQAYPTFSIATTANQEPPAASKGPMKEKQDTPDMNQESQTAEQEKLAPSSAGDSMKLDPLKARDVTVPDSTLVTEDLLVQQSKTDTAAMQTVAKAAAESLKNEMQPQVDALWDAVKWMEDHIETIDADRRDGLENASRVAAQNTAKVSLRKEEFFIGTTFLSHPHYCADSCCTIMCDFKQPSKGLSRVYVALRVVICTVHRCLTRRGLHGSLCQPG